MSPNLTSFASFYPYIYMCGSGSVFRIPKLLNTYPYWNCIQELCGFGSILEYGSGSTHINIGIKTGKRCQIR